MSVYYSLGKKLIIVAVIFLYQQNIFASVKYTPKTTNPLYEEWRWKNLQQLNDKGLRCLVEGENNSMWFGTSKGIFYYDGYEWIRYNKESEILKKPVYGLFFTDDKILYAVTLNGICHYREGIWIDDMNFSDYRVLGNEWEILNIKQTSDGDIWFAVYFGLIRISDNKITLYTTHQQIYNSEFENKNLDIVYIDGIYSEIKDFIIFDILEDKEKNLWLALENGKLIRFRHKEHKLNNPGLFSIFDENDGIYTGRLPVLFKDSDGNIYNVTQSITGGINIYDIKTKTWSSFKISSVFGSDDLNFSVIESKDGALWFGGLKRIHVYKNNRWFEYKQPEIQIPQTRVILKETSDGSIWIAGLLSDVYKVDYNTPRWKTYKGLNYQGETGDHKLWFISTSGEIITHDPENNKWVNFTPEDLEFDTPVRLFIDKSDNIWIIGSHSGSAAIAFKQNNRWHTKLFPDVCWGFHANGCFQSGDGSIYFGAFPDCGDKNWGVVRYLPNLGSATNDNCWEYYAGNEICEVAYALNELDKETLFCGYFKGLYEIKDGKRRAMHEVLLKDMVKIECIEKDLHEGLWIGTRSHGVIHYVNDSEWTQYTLSDGLPSNTVPRILVARDSTIWAVTDKGVSRFDRTNWIEMALPEHFKLKLESGSIFQTSDGSIWLNFNSIDWYRREYFGNEFNEKNSPLYAYRINPENSPPETKVTKYDEKVYHPGNTTIFWTGTDPWMESLTSELEYSFRIDNEEWSPFIKDIFHQYQSMKRGKHVFEVRARDRYLNIDPSPEKIIFTVVPPVWKRTWFIILCFAIGIVIVYMLINTMRKNREISEQSKEVLKKNEDLVKQQKEIEEQNAKIRELLEYERQTRWFNEGVIKVNEITKKYKDDLKELAGHVITMIVEYVDAQASGLFVLKNAEEGGEQILELVASFAYGKKKLKESSFHVGENLVGACCKDKQIMKIDDIPETYTVSSGLGEVKIRHLMLIPLKVHEDVTGVLELGFFKEISERAVNFLELVSETIAVNINTIIDKKKIETMFNRSQEQAQLLREQEEEMKQNIEEMQATQEESKRNEEKLLKEIEELKKKMRKK